MRRDERRLIKPNIFWCRFYASWVAAKPMVDGWSYAFGYSPEAALRYLQEPQHKQRRIFSQFNPRYGFGHNK